MDKKERYERESLAKGGSVPPDMRRNSKARSHESISEMPNEGSSFRKREEATRERAREGFDTVDIEHLSEEKRKAIIDRDLE
jgi:hypothetical protein